MKKFIELVLTAYSNGTKADDKRVTGQMMTFFYLAASRVQDKQKRKKKEEREEETAQKVLQEGSEQQVDATDQNEV